jgi:hypothetical protein
MFPTQMQIDAVTSLVDVDVCGGKLLLIVKTGAGKSHVMRTTGVLLGGVCLIIMPLLALGSDQVSKLTSASQAFGPVQYFHLDEYRTRPQNMLSVLNRVASLSTTTRSTVFLFCSPQIIQNDARVRNCLIEAHSKLLLKSVFLDEVHLYVEHGVSFRDDITQLKDSFFSFIFPSTNIRVHPCFCAMSATFTKKHVSNLEKLIGFSVPLSGVRWGLPDDFCRRDVEIRFSISDDFTTTALNPFFKDIVGGPDSSIKGIVYCNSIKEAIKQLSKVNTMLDNAVNFVGDAIIIHGQQNKIEKFINAKVFLGQVSKSSLTPVILVATSAANCGIDDRRIRYIVRNGLPFSFLSFLQELGRAGRYKGATSKDNYYHVVLNLTNFVNSLHMSHFFNEVKFVKANGNKMEANEIVAHRKTTKFKDDTTKYKALLKAQVCELFDLLSLFCLKQGCVHYILEAYAAHGGNKIDVPFRVNNIDFTARQPCSNACPACTDRYSSYFLPIHRPDAISWLADVVSTSGTIVCGGPNDMVTKLLWEKPQFRFNIFGKKNVTRYQVTAFILQLIASGILTLTTKQTEDSKYQTTCFITYCTLNGKKVPLFNTDSVWDGFSLHTEPRNRHYHSK